MAVARVAAVAFQGVEVLSVDVQVQMAPGSVGFQIVGLPDKAVGESRERVRAALNALGLALPAKRITMNLAPADLLKEGSHFDLPIALALLTALGALPSGEIAEYIALGELGLTAPSLRSQAYSPPPFTLRPWDAASSAPRRKAARRPGPAISACWHRRR